MKKGKKNFPHFVFSLFGILSLLFFASIHFNPLYHLYHRSWIHPFSIAPGQKKIQNI